MLARKSLRLTTAFHFTPPYFLPKRRLERKGPDVAKEAPGMPRCEQTISAKKPPKECPERKSGLYFLAMLSASDAAARIKFPVNILLMSCLNARMLQVPRPM